MRIARRGARRAEPRHAQVRRRARARAGASTPALPDLSRVAGRAVPSVTNISSLQVVRQPNSPFALDPFFRYFFGDGDHMFGAAIASRRAWAPA